MKKTREEEETRAHTRQGERLLTHRPSNERLKQAAGLVATVMTFRNPLKRKRRTRANTRNLWCRCISTRREPVATTLENDLNAINLGRLRRAINQRLSSLDRDYLLDQRELQAANRRNMAMKRRNEENTAENMKSTPTKKNNDKKNKERGSVSISVTIA